MAERPNQNWESRCIDTRGPYFRIDTKNPQMGSDGTDVYTIYGVTDNKDVAIAGLTEGGTYKIYNDKSIELVAGSKGTEGGIDIVIAGMNGDITITAMKNGEVRIKGANVMIQADEDVDIKAGRNINLNASNGRILLKSNKADCNALVGNLAEATTGSFVQRVFLGTKVGPDFLISDGIVSGIGNLPNVVANVAGGLF